jgi:hypothetical protein
MCETFDSTGCHGTSGNKDETSDVDSTFVDHFEQKDVATYSPTDQI